MSLEAVKQAICVVKRRLVFGASPNYAQANREAISELLDDMELLLCGGDRPGFERYVDTKLRERRGHMNIIFRELCSLLGCEVREEISLLISVQ